jgi:hypothetical protein
LNLRLDVFLCRATTILCLLATLQVSSSALHRTENHVLSDEADDDIREFRLGELETTLQTMHAGPDRNYFEGILANRTGRIDDSIRLLSDALPNIRESQPMRASVALEALADDYNKSFRYEDADRAYDDLLQHFGGSRGTYDVQGVRMLV